MWYRCSMIVLIPGVVPPQLLRAVSWAINIWTGGNRQIPIVTYVCKGDYWFMCQFAGRSEFKPTELAYPTAQKGVCLGLLRVWVGYLSDLCSVVKETETVYLAVAPCPCGQPSLCVLYTFVCKWRRSKVVVVNNFCLRICARAYAYMCVCACACICVCIHVRACMHACLCACMRVCVRACVCLDTCRILKGYYMCGPQILVCPALPPTTFQ